ncbi:MAG: hypothetical protein C7B45_08825 [Sulfobacillus acidophilus]|uniref:Uncharacterized protein n=1 Tax=Sulfobacillus acidophilus TaxID=53633 RepID=A0A2T2WIC0_9FIRM|nr:MAG: hypothetical protein C7B45_08825 [Sulfobacillus acidophilus]
MRTEFGSGRLASHEPLAASTETAWINFPFCYTNDMTPAIVKCTGMQGSDGMSTARAHRKNSRDTKAASDGHAFRNALIISLVLAALVLWQLSFVIQGLNTLTSLLVRAEVVRSVLGGDLVAGYHKATALVLPLLERITQP